MSNWNKRLIFGAALVTLSAVEGHGSATNVFDWMVPGSVCQPVDGRTTDWNWSPQFGINRVCTNCAGSSNVVCPVNSLFINLGGIGTLGSATIAVYDRSSTSDVSCTVYLTDDVGNIVFSQTKTSFGNNPGAQEMTYSINVSEQNFVFMTVQCSVPARTASGFSHVVGILGLSSTP